MKEIGKLAGLTLPLAVSLALSVCSIAVVWAFSMVTASSWTS